MPDVVKNVFISHIHEDDSGLGKVKTLVSSAGLSMRDGSINSSKPNKAQSADYIKYSILAPRIAWASTLVVYVTPGTKASEWVNWEIEYAHSLGKRIVGVWAHGHNNCEVPEALEKYADAVVGWHGTSIVDAIIGADTWEKPDGTRRDVQPITRHPC